MAKVIGLGGVFFKSPDPEALGQWYARWLGVPVQHPYGASFLPGAVPPGGSNVWSPFAADTTYFEPSDRPFMFNLMVDDLDAILARAKAAGVEPVKLFPDEGNGKFAHIMDNEGRKIELWQPKPMS